MLPEINFPFHSWNLFYIFGLMSAGLSETGKTEFSIILLKFSVTNSFIILSELLLTHLSALFHWWFYLSRLTRMKMGKLLQMELVFLFLVYWGGFQIFFIAFNTVSWWSVIFGGCWISNVWYNIWKVLIKIFYQLSFVWYNFLIFS